MKRISIVIIALFLACTTARAAGVDEILSGLESYQKTLNTFTARFVQKKHLALFASDVTSRGTFAYKKPQTMVFRYEPPDDTIIGIKPALGLLTIYSPGIKKAQRIHFSPGADMPPWMSLGMGPIGNLSTLKDAAVVTASEVNGAIVISISPKDPKETTKEIVISLKKTYTPLGVKIIEKNGDWTTLDFSDQRENPSVASSVFDVTIPAGVVIEDIGK